MASANRSGGSGFDLPTLAITAAASAGAAYVCSMVWAPGTLASAAFTPVLVALLKEALWRPAKVVTRAVPVRGVVRSATGPGEPPGPVAPVDPAADRVAQQGEIPGRSPSRRRRGWRLAIVTGLLGFLVAAVVITVPEFVAGQAATGGGRDTTLFGGREKESSKPETTTTTTTTTTTVPARTVTVLPAETVTVPAPTTTTAPPAETTTAPPTTTTPVPSGQPTPEAPYAPEPVPPPPPG